MQDPFILTRGRPPLWTSAQSAVHTSSSSAVACSVVTFLGSSGALPASLVSRGSRGVIQGYDLTLNTTHKNQEKPLCPAVEFTEEMTVHREMNGVLWPFEVTLNT